MAAPGRHSNGENEDGDEALEPTHDLILSDGRVVESSGAIPTHYTEGDQVFRVVHVTER